MQRSTLLIGIVWLSMICAPAGPAQAPDSGAMRVAPDEVQAFVRAALENRLRANDVPDLNLAAGSHRLAVRDSMPRAHLILKEAALPEVEGYQLYLLSAAEAQAEADRHNASVLFIAVDEPSINGDSATIWLGVDTAVPSQSGLIKLCCCTGKAEFRRSASSWHFVKWSTMVCS